MKNGRIRGKVGFTAISNNVVKDRSLSLKAKGLYMLIQSFITIPNFDIYMSTLRKECKEGEAAFMNAWKELKQNGYLVQHKERGPKGTYVYEYELLDEKPNSPEHGDPVHPPKNHPLDNPPGGKVGGYNNTYLNKISTFNQSINRTEVLTYQQDLLDTEIDPSKAEKENTKKTPSPVGPEKASFTAPCGTTLGDIIAQNISYYQLRESYPHYERLQLENIYRLLVDVVTSNRKCERIGGLSVPSSRVKEVYLNLHQYHIEYVIECMGKVSGKIYNIKNYLLTALYNAPLTMDSYYDAQARSEIFNTTQPGG